MEGIEVPGLGLQYFPVQDLGRPRLPLLMERECLSKFLCQGFRRRCH
jgi:hypothetical protein